MIFPKTPKGYMLPHTTTPNKSPGSVTPGAPTKPSLMHRGEGEPEPEPAANLCSAFDAAADSKHEYGGVFFMDEDLMDL